MTVFFKDKRKVKSLLKVGAHCSEEGQKVLFRENFQNEILEQGDYLCKLDLKDAFLCFPMNKQSRECVRFE